MIEHVASATYNGQPLAVLSKLIEKRQRWLHETYRQSVSATAINALRSIRAATRTHFGKSNVYLGDITLSRRTDIHPSFSGKERKRCFRAGGLPGRNTAKVDLGKHCVQLMQPSDKAWLQA